MRLYRLSPGVYLERFDEEALVLVSGSDRLLTVNLPAADLFEDFCRAFAGGLFTRQSVTAWLYRCYDLPLAACRDQVRELLAFALRHDLVRPTVAEGSRDVRS